MKMQIKDVVNKVSRKFNGEAENILPNTDDWNTIVSILNEGLDFWQRNPQGVLWQSTYEDYELGEVTTDVSYPIDRDVVYTINQSNREFIRFMDADGKLIDKYKLIPQDIFNSAEDDEKVATINGRGLQIKPQETDSKIFGCKIILPAFMVVSKFDALDATSEAEIDDPYWLVAWSAAQLASTSPVNFLSRNFDAFNTEADNRMQTMININRTAQRDIPIIQTWRPSEPVNAM